MDDHLTTIDGLKNWGAAVPLSVGELGLRVTMSPGLRSTALPSGNLILLRVEMQPRLM